MGAARRIPTSDGGGGAVGATSSLACVEKALSLAGMGVGGAAAPPSRAGTTCRRSLATIPALETYRSPGTPLLLPIWWPVLADLVARSRSATRVGAQTMSARTETVNKTSKTDPGI